METLYKKLADLDLSIRTKNLLRNAGIDTLQELTTYTKSDLIKFLNFGKRSVMELEELMLSNNLNFGMGHTIKSDNTETLANALHQIEKLEADKAELLEALGDCKERLEEMNKKLLKFTNYSHISVYFASKLNFLIRKHKQ